MLALTRKRKQSVVINTSDGLITVKIIRTNGGNVRLGIVAPPKCHILRSELTAKPRPEKPQAA